MSTPVDGNAVSPTTALSIRDLRVLATQRKRPNTEIVKGIDLDVRAGTIHGLAGESGSGKTMTALATMGLLPRNTLATGHAHLGATDLIGRSEKGLRPYRARHLSMVFQDPSTSPHPQLTIGRQLTDHVRLHLGSTKKEARDRAVSALERVDVPEPENALKKYPHQFSGGQRQRVAIAIALACDPEVLLADEPTTALDVTVQAGILQLLRRLVDESNLGVLLVTHDLGVMSSIADEVSVMRYGEILETGVTHDIFTSPQHPYTVSLLEAMPGADLVATEEHEEGTGADE
jgi:ABC-type dipeptide/oligopeptide/nickel transport system ATPase component